MNTHVRDRGSHARRIFIEVSPRMRRTLEALAEAAIDALDQLDGDPDLEDDCEDSQCDDEGGDREHSLGWTEEIATVVSHDYYHGLESD